MCAAAGRTSVLSMHSAEMQHVNNKHVMPSCAHCMLLHRLLIPSFIFTLKNDTVSMLISMHAVCAAHCTCHLPLVCCLALPLQGTPAGSADRRM